MRFPEGFVWGTATSAYQIEGAALEDGKGPSVWDVFCRRSGATWQGQSGEVACDHYHRHREDVALLGETGVRAYRFSISWPRVLPEGIGTANRRGLAFYDRLVDEVLAAGIEPYVNLFHWDYPYALYCRGGWLNPQAPEWFGEYAAVVAGKLGDRVRHWMTINEPQVVGVMGHHDGTHAPGDHLQLRQVLQITHHLLLAHGRAVQAIRAARSDSQVGLVSTGPIGLPATSSPADVEAARQATYSIAERTLWSHSWWMDPIFLGRYPEDGCRLFGADMPAIGGEDMATISQPLDFFGLNIYNGHSVRQGRDGRPVAVPQQPGQPLTANGWLVTPEALYWGPRLFWERYGLPILIAENGLANIDWMALDGRVHDPQRIDFTRRYLLQLARAIAEGVGVHGYFHWSALDNFEWADGTRYRFGLIYVDYGSQARTLKDSAYWYREVIDSHGEALATEPPALGHGWGGCRKG